jgi:hypothetical protein
MDLLKFIFEHDLRLNAPRERTPKHGSDNRMSIEDFMKPDPTYSRFYISGTILEDEKFGLSALSHYDEVMDALDQALNNSTYLRQDNTYQSLAELLPELEIGQMAVIQPDDVDLSAVALNFTEWDTDQNSNVGLKRPLLKDLIEAGGIAIYKEKAHHGFDLHLLMRENRYEAFYNQLKPLIEYDDFRFFSINGKRTRSERLFYFETWTLDRPPHGTEEVLPETKLR